MTELLGLVLLMGLVIFANAHPLDSEFVSAARIVGGTEIKIEEVPWQVSLQTCFPSNDSSRCFHNCGGFIISEKWIMTAGHCTKNGYKVRLGTNDNKKGGVLVDAKQMIRHKMYSERTLDYDYALIELKEVLNFTDKVKAIKLPAEDDILPDGTACFLSGWGQTMNIQQPINILRKITHPIINQTECALDVQDVVKLTPRMVCAGSRGDGKSGCFGDSGGPLACTLDGIRKVIGIASYVTSGCRGPENRTVYARVQAARKWIKTITGI